MVKEILYSEIEGNLLDLFEAGAFDYIGQGCNCFCLMGAGIAAQIKDRYPTAYEADFLSDLSPNQKLGNFIIDSHSNVINLYTQFHPGKNLDIEALTLAFRKLNLFFGRDKIRLGLPLIGCGIAGGDWEEVSEIIKRECTDIEVVIVKFKN